MYPALPPALSRFHYDPFYYSRFANYWRDVELPTAGMLRRALPDCTVSAGGVAERFVYFQKVDPKAPGIRFRMRVVNAADDRLMGSIEIPFAASCSARGRADPFVTRCGHQNFSVRSAHIRCISPGFPQ